jgi:transposase
VTTQDQLDFWTKTLRLDGFRVAHHHLGSPDEALRFTLVPAVEVGVCPQCGKPSDQVHRRHTADRVADLPIGTQAVELTIRTYQYRCPHCERYFTPPRPGLAPGAHATERFLERAARLIRISAIANAAAFLGVAEKSLQRWYYDYVERQQAKPPAATRPIRQLGIDELSLKKGTASLSVS